MAKPERFEEAKTELDAILADEELVDVPIAILANKIDSPKAVSPDQLIDYFNLRPLLTGVRNIYFSSF